MPTLTHQDLDDIPTNHPLSEYLRSIERSIDISARELMGFDRQENKFYSNSSSKEKEKIVSTRTVLNENKFIGQFVLKIKNGKKKERNVDLDNSQISATGEVGSIANVGFYHTTNARFYEPLRHGQPTPTYVANTTTNDSIDWNNPF